MDMAQCGREGGGREVEEVGFGATTEGLMAYTTGWCSVQPLRGRLRFGGFMFEGLFQPMHLLVIFAIALLVFGPKKLPELGKGLGDGIRALKEGMKDHDTKADAKTVEAKSVEAKTEVKPEIKPENPESKT
jgi:sec-independent protein translocase protein TatA